MLLVGLLLAILFALPSTADACSCVTRPYVCGDLEYARGDSAATFVGTVLKITEVMATTETNGRKERIVNELRVLLSVEETFGGRRLGRRVEVSTAPSRPACGYEFRLGERYLVRASRHFQSGELSVSHCSRTKPLSEAFDDVELLRAAQRGRRETRIFGSVRFRAQGGGPSDELREGLRVVATSAGQSFVTATDARGAFRFQGLPFGRYVVRAWRGDQVSKESRQPPVLTDAEHCAEVDFFFDWGARVAGTVTDARGVPLGEVRIALHDENADLINDSIRWGYSDARGRYEIERVLPGRHVLGVVRPRGSLRTLPHLRVGVGTETGSSPNLLIVDRDQNVEGVDIVVPPFELATLQVHVASPDGAPRDRVALTVHDEDGVFVRRLEQNEPVRPARFDLELIVGRSYRIQAHTTLFGFCPRRELRPAVSIVRVEAQNEPLTFRVECAP